MAGPSPLLPLASLVLATFAGVVVTVVAGWEPGLLLLGSALVVGAVARLALAPEQAGLLVVRSRALDVGLLALLGIGMIVLSATLPT
ncbi:MAG: DUF3017 domain-containing protein [Mycobacteriales bacterium]